MVEGKKEPNGRKSAKAPFANLAGLIKSGGSFLEMRRKLEKDLEEGKLFPLYVPDEGRSYSGTLSHQTNKERHAEPNKRNKG